MAERVRICDIAEEIVQFASMWNMDGIVVIGFCEQDYELLRSRMRIPFVVYDGLCRAPQRFLNLTIDNFDGGQQVGRHLRALGHETALCISDNDVGIDRERMLGFRRGFAPGNAAPLIVPMRKAERQAFYRQNPETLRRATAVFAVSDAFAVDLMGFLLEQGIRVPEDISVAGFDDTPVCALAIPAALQSMMQSSFSMVDQIMIGQLGAVSVAGVGLAGKFVSIYSVIVSAVGAVAGIMVAQYLGQEMAAEVRRSFFVNLALAAVIAGIFTAVCALFPETVMRAYTKDTATRRSGCSYTALSGRSSSPSRWYCSAHPMRISTGWTAQ